ncbi:MAG: TetR/AcrR family transcriptional regulator [Alphaproteobacteria bacterium]
MARSAGRPPRSATDIHEYRSKIGRQALKIYYAEGFDAISMRRLAKEVGCAPMTIYAHFEGKTDVLRYIWADILKDLSDGIQQALEPASTPQDRLHVAAQTFVSFWITQPEHFRLVFMSSDVNKADVTVFVTDSETAAHFQVFERLIGDAVGDDRAIKVSTDTLISGLIGIALSHNTIPGYAWAEPALMAKQLVTGILCD